MSARYAPSAQSRSPRLARTVLRLAIVLGVVALLRLLPAGAFVALGLVFLALLALATWNPVASLLVASAIATVVIARRRL